MASPQVVFNFNFIRWCSGIVIAIKVVRSTSWKNVFAQFVTSIALSFLFGIESRKFMHSGKIQEKFFPAYTGSAWSQLTSLVSSSEYDLPSCVFFTRHYNQNFSVAATYPPTFFQRTSGGPSAISSLATGATARTLMSMRISPYHFLYTLAMELFSRRRWRLDRPKQKAVVFMLNPTNLCNTCMSSFHRCLTVGPIQLFISFY